MKKQKGFTLIELMVVMAIIAILATAGLSAYTSYIKGARDSKRVTMARELQTVVESLSTISGAPTPTELTTYLNAEGIAWNIPTETPLLVRAAESVVGVLGIPDALALLEDPIGGKAVCLNHANEAVMVCQFVYYQFSDGTYAISYGVEKESSLVNAHYSSTLVAGGGQRTYGSFIGNNAAISISPTLPTTDIEDESINTGVTVVGATVTTLPNGATNGAGQHDTGGVGGGPVVIAGNTWMTTDLSGYYQWMRKTPVTTSDWPGAGTWIADPFDSDYGDPCEASGGRMPTEGELGSLTVQNRIDLGFTMNGYLNQSDNGILTDLNNFGYYWSSDGSGAYGIYHGVNTDYTGGTGPTDAAFAASVRCIQN